MLMRGHIHNRPRS